MFLFCFCCVSFETLINQIFQEREACGICDDCKVQATVPLFFLFLGFNFSGLMTHQFVLQQICVLPNFLERLFFCYCCTYSFLCFYLQENFAGPRKSSFIQMRPKLWAKYLWMWMRWRLISCPFQDTRFMAQKVCQWFIVKNDCIAACRPS